MAKYIDMSQDCQTTRSNDTHYFQMHSIIYYSAKKFKVRYGTHEHNYTTHVPNGVQVVLMSYCIPCLALYVRVQVPVPYPLYVLGPPQKIQK